MLPPGGESADQQITRLCQRVKISLINIKNIYVLNFDHVLIRQLVLFHRCQESAICSWLVSQSSAHSKDIKAHVWIPQADGRANQAGKVRVKEESMIVEYHTHHL